MEAATYLMPIRRPVGPVDDELTRYLSEIGRRCELIVVDGSDPRIFRRGARGVGRIRAPRPP